MKEDEPSSTLTFSNTVLYFAGTGNYGKSRVHVRVTPTGLRGTTLGFVLVYELISLYTAEDGSHSAEGMRSFTGDKGSECTCQVSGQLHSPVLVIACFVSNTPSHISFGLPVRRTHSCSTLS